MDWGNKKEVLAVVSSVGYLLQWASDDLRGDKEVVLAALKQTKYSLIYASKEIKGLCKGENPAEELEDVIMAELAAKQKMGIAGVVSDAVEKVIKRKV